MSSGVILRLSIDGCSSGTLAQLPSPHSAGNWARISWQDLQGEDRGGEPRPGWLGFDDEPGIDPDRACDVEVVRRGLHHGLVDFPEIRLAAVTLHRDRVAD